MLDIKFIRENPTKVKESCKNKQAKVDIDKILELDEKKRGYLREIEILRSKKGKIGKDNIREAQEIKAIIKKTEPELERVEKEIQDLLVRVPNLCCEDIPVGKGEKDNIVLKEWGKKTEFNFQARDYLEITENLDLIDIKRAAKVAGTRFGFLKREAALLEFALVDCAFDILAKEGFIPLVPPIMIKPEMAKGMGYLEQTDDEEAYFLEKDNLYLAGTSEQPIGIMHANEIFAEKELPKRYVGFSTCFRREAGAYGKDTRGIFRVHQFDKVEMFSFCHPDKSKKEHQFLLSMEEKLMQALKIPYRVVHICTGDLGNPAAAKYDIEGWFPGQNQYRETHSTSNCTDFQARRLNIRYRSAKTQKLEFLHTLNGTAFAIGRTIIAIIENYQQKDDSIKVPKALQRYLKFKIIKKP